MKKFTVILLWAALALPVMAQKTAQSKSERIANSNDRTVEQVAGKPLNLFNGTLQSVTPKAEATVIYECSFETDEELAQWSIIDADGDGYNWEVDDYYNHTEGGSQSVTSRSYYGGTALTPDNWLISPSLPLGGTFSVYAENYSSSYPDVFAIYVCEGTPSSPDDFVKVSDDITPPTSWTLYEVDLSAYAGKEGCVAIRHYNSVDQMRLLIDDVTLTGSVALMPTNLTVNPENITATSAIATWDDQDNVRWNLRYRPLVEQTATIWDFEEDTNGNQNIDLTGGWTTIDADGDGNAWYHLYGASFTNHSGLGHVTSASYQSTALFPDNWLVSPKVTLTGDLSFWAAGQDASWAGEIFAVYVAAGETADPTNTASFVKISDDITATGVMTQYTFDLSAYEGTEGYVAIRHYNISDMFRLNIDDIAIGEVIPEPEWQYVYDLTEKNYTIEGLTPETTYEVQVQGNDEAKAFSSWTESTIFTTLAEEPAAPKFYITGGFNGWQVVELPEEGYTFDVVEDPADVESKEFKLQVLINDNMIWLGGIDNNNVGYFEVSEDMMTAGTEIELYADDETTQYANFRLPGSGNYTVTLAKEGAKGLYERAKIVVSHNNTVPTGVNDINSKAVKSVKYVNIAGVESNKPFDGVNIMVTTYTDGTKAATKVIK